MAAIPVHPAMRRCLIEVLVYHQQRCADSGCHCGWGKLGASWAEHVADVFEDTWTALRVTA